MDNLYTIIYRHCKSGVATDLVDTYSVHGSCFCNALVSFIDYVRLNNIILLEIRLLTVNGITVVVDF